MRQLDFNCFSGNWPFHKIRSNSVDKLCLLHRRCGIEGGFISSFEAIFYQDPYEAELELAKQLEGKSYYHVMVVNPTLPAWKSDIKRAIVDLGICAVRLLPGYHKYHLLDPMVADMMEQCRKFRLPVFLTMRLQDERATWMLHPKQVDIMELASFLERNDDVLTLVTGLKLQELDEISALCKQRRNLFIDTSFIKDGLFAIEKACGKLPPENLVYGSLAPLLELQATYLQVKLAKIDDSIKEMIFGGQWFLKQLNGMEDINVSENCG